MSILSLIDSDSLVFNYILLHSKNKIDTFGRFVGENITLLRKKDSLFRVLYRGAEEPLIYSTDTLKMYLGQLGGSSNTCSRVRQYIQELCNDNRNLLTLLSNVVTPKKNINIFWNLKKNKRDKPIVKVCAPLPQGEPIYVEGDSCEIVKIDGTAKVILKYFCTDKYPNNPCSDYNNRGHRKTIVQLEGLLMKHLHMVQAEGEVIKLSESKEKIENPYEVAKFLISRAYYHLPEDKLIHSLTYE